MEAQLNTAFQLVAQHDTQAIKQGEHMLGLLKKNKNYPIALLHYMNSSTVSPEGKLRAAIELKLWAEFFKGLEEFQRGFYEDIVESIKESMLHAYLHFPPQISKTLLPGLVSLADVLFPNKWENLMTGLVGYCAQSQHAAASVLKLIQDITHKYTFLSRSDPLYEEIIKVCNEIHDFLKELTVEVLKRVMAHPGATGEADILECLMKLFYNLNFQDLHPKYEDNLHHWMEVLKAVMKLPNTSQGVFRCKGAALEAILLYANKYKEDVQQPIKDFCVEIWPLCASASDDPEYDSIVFNCLKFFKSLINWSDMKPFFIENMDQFFQTLILPNIAVNSAAVALFQDQPEVFIDYYFRNTELQTRRAAAIELLRIICRSYSTFEPFLMRQIQNFMALPKKDVIAECTLLGLTIDGCSKGFRDVEGCTQLFVKKEIIEFCYNSIVKVSLGSVYSWACQHDKCVVQDVFNPMHVTTLIRFLFYFRIFFPKEELASLLQFLSKLYTRSDSLRRAIHLAINGFLIIKHGDYDTYKNLTPYFTPYNLSPVAIDILRVVYQGTVAEKFLQEGLTKMLLNITKGLQEANSQFFSYQKEIISEMLKRTECYDFNSAQFLFESIGMMAFYYIRANSPHKGTLEQIVIKFFNVATKNGSDLLNFCLQVLAIFLQLQKAPNKQYCVIYQSLLMAENWKEENQSVMSSYIQYIISFLSRVRERLLSDRPAIEVILSKVIQIDHIELFYRFLEAIMQNTSLQEFESCGYLRILVQGSQELGKSIQGRKAALLFLSKFLTHNNHLQALHMINSYCPGFYDQLLEASSDILRTISLRRDRKFIFVAICRAIDSNYFSNGQLQGAILDNLISNTVDRFAIKNISNHIQETDTKEKKEATYRKLQVFKEFEKPEIDLQVQQQELFVKTFKQAVNMRGHLLQFISERNKERIIRLSDRYSK